MFPECKDGMVLDTIEGGEKVAGDYLPPPGYRVMGFGDLARMQFPSFDALKVSE